MSSPIVKYIVQIPDSTPLSRHDTEDEAKKQCAKANRMCCPGHQIFAEHADETISGPH